MALSSIRASLESSQGGGTTGIWRHRRILCHVTFTSKTGEAPWPSINIVTYHASPAVSQHPKRSSQESFRFRTRVASSYTFRNMDLLFLIFLSTLILLGVGNSAPLSTPTTGTPSTASMTSDAASATCPPNTSVFDSLNLTDPATWFELGIIWVGFFIGFLQAWFIYYLLTGASSRRGGRKCSPDTHNDSTGRSPQRRSKGGPRRLCLFERGMTRQDYEAYFWDPEGYGRRRYEEQERRSLHSKLLRCFGRWFGFTKHEKSGEQPAPEAAETVATFRTRRHHHPCELRAGSPPSVLAQPNTDPAAFVAGALQEPYHPAQSLYDTTRRRKVTGDRARAWNDYSGVPSGEAATIVREWSRNTTDYYDAFDRFEKDRSYIQSSTEDVHKTVLKRAYTSPIPAMRPETENAMRAAREGSYATKGHHAETSELATTIYFANEYNAKDYEARASIDLEISSCGSSNGTFFWPTIRADHTRVMSNALSEQPDAASEASRISQVPPLNPSAGYILPKTRCSAVKPPISCTEPTPGEERF